MTPEEALAAAIEESNFFEDEPPQSTLDAQAVAILAALAASGWRLVRDEERGVPSCEVCGARVEPVAWYHADGVPAGQDLTHFARLAATTPGAPARAIRHGRHCPCSACAHGDWTDPDLAPCDYHQGVRCAYSPGVTLTPTDRQTPADFGGDELRKALAVLDADARDPNRKADWRYGVRHTLSVIRAALALPAPSLTVEALARAMRTVEDPRGVSWPEGYWESRAENLLRALADPSGTTRTVKPSSLDAAEVTSKLGDA